MFMIGHYTASYGIIDNNDLNGYSTFMNDKEKIYAGECEDDVRHGLGKLITSDGVIFK